MFRKGGLFKPLSSIVRMASKRKASQDSGGAKRLSTSSSHAEFGGPKYHPNAKQTEEFGIVLRQFYPPEMSNERCEAYNNGTLERPFDTLERVIRETEKDRQAIKPGKSVVHWFKSDLRLHDSHGLAAAYQTAKENGIPLICVYILSPEDLTAHLSSPPRIDLTLRTLRKLQGALDERDIPLYMETQNRRSVIPDHIVELCKQWGANHLFANIEYEVDELRREAKLVKRCAKEGINFTPLHDACIVKPGEILSGSHKMYAVYKAWFRSWVSYLDGYPDVLDPVPTPEQNPGNARKQYKELFGCKLPEAPKDKTLSAERKEHFRKIFPEGEEEAFRRLETFLKGRGKDYEEIRNLVGADGTSKLSPYFTSGSLSTRHAIKRAKQLNQDRIDDSKEGEMDWVSEVAWRDFYKHVLVQWPFICMNKCFKPEFTDLPWEYDTYRFDAWCQGKTGVPIVDAAMRQLNHDGWMHNRSRMIVASFLCKDFLIDWRCGEKYFMEHLIDGDFASNHGGWGFSSSTGVDPQPYFRIFNPVTQSEKFDPGGEYIRRWIPELRDIQGKAIHDPYHRHQGEAAEKAGYAKPIVEHGEMRERALALFHETTGHKRS